MSSLSILHLRSIKTRVTLFTITIFVIGIWLLSFLNIQKLYEDLEKELGYQQSSVASLLASQINEELSSRVALLNKIAEIAAQKSLSNQTELQTLLENQVAIESNFNAGAFILDANGIAIASVPLSVDRIGVSYIKRAFVVAALKRGESSISKPVIGTVIKEPLFNVVVPIKNKDGKTIGAILGVTTLGKPNFLDKIFQNNYGKSGYLLLEDAKNRLVITGTDKRRIMQPLPQHGANALTDRHVAGFDETDISINPLGVEVLITSKRVPISDWFIVAGLPTHEAFSAIRKLKVHIFLIATFITFIAAGLTWWMLRRELAPMFATVKKLTALSKSGGSHKPLPIETHNEIGELIESFNNLLEALEKREAHLSILLKTIPDLIWLKDINGVYISCNTMVERFFGTTEANIIGKTDYDFVDKDLADFFRDHDRKAMIAGKTTVNEEWLTFADGGYHGLFETKKAPLIDSNGHLIGIFGIAHDITARKNNELKLRLLSTAIEQSPTSVAITNLESKIEYVNPTFTKEAGYNPDEVIGKNPRILQSGLTDKSVYDDMWSKLALGQNWTGEFINKRKNGEIYYEEAYISPVLDDSGKTTHYVALKVDITEKKQVQSALKKSNEQLNNLLQSMAEGAYGVDVDGNCTFVNNSFLTILGFQHADEIIGKHIHTLIHHSHIDGSDYPADTCKVYSAYKNNIEIHCADEVFWRKDGQAISVEYWSRPIFEEGVMVGAIATFIDITERKKMEEKIQQLALHDMLTDLPNRRLLLDRMDQILMASKRSHLYSALIYLDLDNFKPLNDTLGHEAGDQLLIEVSNRLKNCVREMDTVARMGGDEFVAIITKISSNQVKAKSQAAIVAEKIRSSLSEPYYIKVINDENKETIAVHHCTASIGVVLFSGENNTSKEALIKIADGAMYQAKESSRNNVVFSENNQL
ncbi:PAS domain S-box protein [Methylotenera sp. L2L1]|uniref:PAS domain S-box protein n=1 Tax=Methylotenera sp. L2L1 TaxID=1502770 RepID=UPI00069152B0|nr:PAS domain S-box protein [Methylotenera sp. L2L1]